MRTGGWGASRPTLQFVSMSTPRPCTRLAPRRGTQTVEAPVPPFHTVPGSKGALQGMWKKAVFV